MCSGRVSSSCSISGTCCVNLVTSCHPCTILHRWYHGLQYLSWVWETRVFKFPGWTKPKISVKLVLFASCSRLFWLCLNLSNLKLWSIKNVCKSNIKSWSYFNYYALHMILWGHSFLVFLFFRSSVCLTIPLHFVNATSLRPLVLFDNWSWYVVDHIVPPFWSDDCYRSYGTFTLSCLFNIIILCEHHSGMA